MKLKTSDGGEKRHPTPDEVSGAVRRLAMNADEFVILQRALEDYVQISGGRLEYRDASGHYRADSPVTVELADRVFSGFLDGGDKWRGLVKWRDAEEELEREALTRWQRRNSPSSWLFAIVVFGCIAAYAWWRSSG
ncbi:MAG: hypothetical protein ACKVS9_16190 [Phycisphaerae bacterium]